MRRARSRSYSPRSQQSSMRGSTSSTNAFARSQTARSSAGMSAKTCVVVGVEPVGDVIAGHAFAGYGGVDHPSRLAALSVADNGTQYHARPASRGESDRMTPCCERRGRHLRRAMVGALERLVLDGRQRVGQRRARVCGRTLGLLEPTSTSVGAVRPLQRSAGSGSAMLRSLEHREVVAQRRGQRLRLAPQRQHPHHADAERPACRSPR